MFSGQGLALKVKDSWRSGNNDQICNRYEPFDYN